MSKNKTPKDIDVVKEILDGFDTTVDINKKAKVPKQPQFNTRKPKQNKPKYHTQYDYSLQDIANASEK